MTISKIEHPNNITQNTDDKKNFILINQKMKWICQTLAKPYSFYRTKAVNNCWMFRYEAWSKLDWSIHKVNYDIWGVLLDVLINSELFTSFIKMVTNKKQYLWAINQMRHEISSCLRKNTFDNVFFSPETIVTQFSQFILIAMK